MWPLEDDQHLAAVLEAAPQGIGPRHVGEEGAARPSAGIEHEGDMRGLGRAVRAARDQEGEVEAAHEAVKPAEVGLGEMGGHVHGAGLVVRFMAGGPRPILTHPARPVARSVS